jgi:hypothetical protein
MLWAAELERRAGSVCVCFGLFDATPIVCGLIAGALRLPPACRPR